MDRDRVPSSKHRLNPRSGLLCLVALSASVSAPTVSAESADAIGATSATANCIACNKPVGPAGIQLQHRGRQVHVHAGVCHEHWEADRDALFTPLQARGALFDEEAMPATTGDYGWLYFGLYVLAGLLAGALCAFIAISRGRAGLPWFAAGLFLNVVAVVLVLTRPRLDTNALPAGIPRGFAKVPLTHTPTPCPQCGETNHPSASRCAGCGADLQPTATAESARL